MYLSVDEKSDPLYFKFTSAKQSGLILGSSIAGQAINPDVLESEGVAPVYNYAFTAPLSPFGPSYLRAIKGKLKPSTKDGIFIITVEPLAISSDATDPNDSLLFEERNYSLGKLSSFSSNPNLEYLVHYYNDYNLKLLWNKSVLSLQDNGWLKVDLPKKLWDVETRIVDGHYKNKLGLYQFSKTRLDYLKKTITYLKSHGDVYLVRLPVHEKYIAMDKEYMPNFESILKQLSGQYDIPYLSLAPLASKFDYLDGTHTSKESSSEISKIIAQFIIKSK